MIQNKFFNQDEYDVWLDLGYASYGKIDERPKGMIFIQLLAWCDGRAIADMDLRILAGEEKRL